MPTAGQASEGDARRRPGQHLRRSSIEGHLDRIPHTGIGPGQDCRVPTGRTGQICGRDDRIGQAVDDGFDQLHMGRCRFCQSAEFKGTTEGDKAARISKDRDVKGGCLIRLHHCRTDRCREPIDPRVLSDVTEGDPRQVTSCAVESVDLT